MGKRQIGELAPSELVVAVLISDRASLPLQDTGIPLLYGIVPVLTLLCTEVLMSYATLHSIRFREFVGGKPSVIIYEGRLNQREMGKNRLTLDELTVEMRKQNVMDIAKVRHAILESDGSLSIFLYASEEAVTPKELGLNAEDEPYPLILISDGRVLSSNLKKLGFDEKWLEKRLHERNVKSSQDVYVLSADKNGKIYYCKKEH